eukprot:840726-Pyramimonas_sp.AAC.1
MPEISSGSIVCERIAKKSQAGTPSLWGSPITLRTRAGHRNHVTVVTVGLLRLEYEGHLEREPRLG